MLLPLLFPAEAQRKDFTLEEIVLNESLAPATLPQLSWITGSDDYFFIQGSGKGQQLMRGAARSSKQAAILQLADLSSAVEKAGGNPVQEFPEIRWTSSETFLLNQQNRIYTYDLKSGNAALANSFAAEAKIFDLHPVRLHVAFTLGRDLFVAMQGAGKVPVTNQAYAGWEEGQPILAGKNKFEKPTLWSPSGNLLAYYLLRQPTSETSRPPVLEVGVFDVRNQQSVELKRDEAWPYLTHLTWSPDEKHLYAVRLNPAQDHLQVNQYEAATGNLVKTLFEEKSTSYLAPKHGLFFVPRHPDRFVWASDRDGYTHLYLYNTQGQLLRRLTAGNWVVTELLGFDQEGKNAFYVSTAESPIERHFYGLHLNTGKTNRISQGTGVHVPQISPGGAYFLSSFSSFVVARQIRLLDRSGKIRQTLLTERNPLENYRTGEITLLPIKGADGADLYCRLITPADFDPGRKYPVVLYVGGHPQEQRITNSWLGGGKLWMQWLAQQGFVVFALDGRGSANRGRDFAQATFGGSGVLEGQDQLQGIDYLTSLDYVDPARIGVYGKELGGHLATSLLLNAPAAFKAGVALNPTLTWPSYHTLFPGSTDPKSRQETDLVQYLGNLKGKLLIAYAQGEPAGPPIRQLLQAAEEKKIPIDTYVYAGQEGRLPAKTRIDLLQQIMQYVQEHL